MMLEPAPMLPRIAAALPDVRWFSPSGCVIRRDASIEVSVGGALIGCYAKRDVGGRNAILVGLATDRRVHLGQLADAFGLSTEMARRIRRRYEREGLAGIVGPRPPSKRALKITPALRRRLEALFEQGESVSAAHAVVAKKHVMGRAMVGVVRKEWAERKAQAAKVVVVAAEQTTLPLAECIAAPPRTSEAMVAVAATEAVSCSPSRSPSPPPSSSPSLPPSAHDLAPEGEPQSSASMQHAGSLLLVALMERYGMYRLADEICAKHDLAPSAIRVALDAFAFALAIGEGCVEGVRRLATPSAPALLRTPSCPSADWVRRTLHAFADVGAPRFHFGMAGRYLDAARDERGPAVFYVDNHLRPYTGQEVLRRGWRMQDKRVLPGASDFYVHDEDGRPALRTVAPAHGSLTEKLLEIADLLRAGLGDEQRILLAFDRGGAFPETLAALREDSYEFVTYERRPYRLLLPTEFTREMVLDVGDGAPERIAFAEFRVPLGRGRGDVRRIALRAPEGRQVNLLAISQEPAERLVAIQRGRWRQENGFKHGVERWSINQLDGRRTEAYAPETIVPNPARRRLNHALRLACVDEGLARRLLARLADDDPKHAKAAVALAEAIEQQRELLARRETTPTYAPLAETELAGKLVYHPGAYKTVLDTVRIAAANAEADLAEWLAPHLPRAAEAKKTLANLFVAPGRVHVGARTIRIDLAPAGTTSEHRAFAALFAAVNRADLILPGDSNRRMLRFGSQL
jgi:hypothetical protein